MPKRLVGGELQILTKILNRKKLLTFFEVKQVLLVVGVELSLVNTFFTQRRKDTKKKVIGHWTLDICHW
jgi:hypothetical protein